MPPADTIIDRAKWVQIDIREKVAYRIAAADDRLGRARQWQSHAICHNNQLGWRKHIAR